MASVSIRPVRTRSELKRFVKVPFRLHRDSEQWVPPLIFERMEFLEDGRVLEGPSVHAQPVLEVRIRDGQIEVRKANA